MPLSLPQFCGVEQFLDNRAPIAVDERIGVCNPVDDHRFHRLHTGHHRTACVDLIKIKRQALALIAD